LKRRTLPLLAAISFPLTVPAHASAATLWAGDAEHPLSAEWASGNAFDINAGRATSTLSTAWNASTTRVRRVTSPVAQGRYAYAMTVRAADRDAYASTSQRTELGQNNVARTFRNGSGDRQMRQGEERWIAVQVRVPAGYPAGRWTSLVQLKGQGSGNGPLAVLFERGKLRLKKSQNQTYGSTDFADVWVAPAATVRGRWIKLLVHVKWSTGPDGFYELFGDLADGRGFRQLKPLTAGWTLKFAANGGPVAVGARFGVYRSAVAMDSTLYFDGFTVAARRADAKANAFSR
jgi:hypothetical protein